MSLELFLAALTEHPHKKNIKWKKEKKTETTMLPRYVAELAEILEMDPDPYFKGVRKNLIFCEVQRTALRLIFQLYSIFFCLIS